MQQTLIIANELFEAEIDTRGAWLTSWRMDDSNILFPKQTYKLADGAQKVRGGCHVCLPNFGPGDAYNLPQHGFAREDDWSVVERRQQSVTLSLIKGDGPYVGLAALLSYDLSDRGITMQLQIINNGSQTHLISPGFHPYFEVVSDQLTIGGDQIEVAKHAKPLDLTQGPSKTIRTARHEVTVASHNLEHWVAWSDRLGSYFCVEPTQAGFSFEQSAESAMVSLKSGDTWSCSLSMAVTEV